MDATGLNLILLPAPDDPPWRSDVCQGEIRAFAELLSAHGVEHSSSSLDLREAWSPEPLQVIYLGEFTVKLVATIVPPLIAALAGWLQGRYGRRVRLRVGDLEAEAPSITEVERLFARAQEISDSKREPRIILQSED